MFSAVMGGITALFSKFFSAADSAAVLAAIPEGTRQVVFVDTGATPVLVETITALLERKLEVYLYDHHRGEGRTPEATEAIEALLGERAKILSRAEAPGCLQVLGSDSFVLPGCYNTSSREEDQEWGGHDSINWCCSCCVSNAPRGEVMIVADPDPDGLLAAMWVSGAGYQGIQSDAPVLDGPRSEQTAERLTPLALLLAKGMATLPPFNPANPEVAEKAKAELFQNFVRAAYGYQDDIRSLESRVAAYEAAVAVAEEIAKEASEIASGVVLADTCGKRRHDLATLTQRLEARPGCRITVVRKDSGPIAAKHGTQYSLAVVKSHQGDTNLQELLPGGFTSSPETGIISNTTFLLHVSESVWEETVLPALRARSVTRA